MPDCDTLSSCLNKTQYFRLQWYDSDFECSLSVLWVLDCSSIVCWVLSDLERWSMTALDKFVPHRQTDGRTLWLLELLSEPKIWKRIIFLQMIVLRVSWWMPSGLRIWYNLSEMRQQTWDPTFHKHETYSPMSLHKKTETIQGIGHQSFNGADNKQASLEYFYFAQIRRKSFTRR